MGRKIKFLILPLLFIVISCSQDEEIISPEEEIVLNNNLTIEEEILKLVNEHRASIGKSKLNRNSVADDLAKEHSNYMINKGEISHDNFNDRFNELKQKVNAKSAGENVAFGYSSAKAVMDGWLNSSGHKANIEGDFTHIGISVIKDNQARYYYTQLFYRK